MKIIIVVTNVVMGVEMCVTINVVTYVVRNGCVGPDFSVVEKRNYAGDLDFGIVWNAHFKFSQITSLLPRLGPKAQHSLKCI